LKIVEQYKGIKRGYPRIKLPGKTVALLQNSRPFTLLLPLLGGYFVMQASLPAFTVPTPNPVKTWLALLSLVLIYMGGNNFNSIFDIEVDRVNKPYRPLPRGALTVREVSLFTLATYILAALISLTVNSLFSLLAASLILSTVVYSMPPARLKARLWINNVSQAFMRGVLGVLAAWSVHSPLTPQAFAVSAVMFTFILPAQTSKDFGREMVGDRKFGVKTLPVVYGVDGARKLMTIMMPAPFIVLSFLVYVRVLPLETLWMTILMPVAVWIPEGVSVESNLIENQFGWAAFYACMVAFLLFFALVM